jgi:hypothetical protein
MQAFTAEAQRTRRKAFLERVNRINRMNKPEEGTEERERGKIPPGFTITESQAGLVGTQGRPFTRVFVGRTPGCEFWERQVIILVEVQQGRGKRNLP